MKNRVPEIVVLDYGMGNLRSVVKAFEHLGAHVRLVLNPEEIGTPDGLVFPGQGAIVQCVQRLKETGLDTAIRSWIAEDRPFFGICLGLQVLFEHSEEGDTPGLGIFPGTVVRFDLGSQYKVPHIGWNAASFCGTSPPLTQGLTLRDDQFYFVHSYYVKPKDPEIVWCQSSYGHSFVSGIHSSNCFATQFHPEKSQSKGLQIYKNFLQWTIDSPQKNLKSQIQQFNMETNATIRIADKNYDFPTIVGTEGECAIDTRTLRSKSGLITYDNGYANTGSCKSSITYIDGEKGILRYRGYPIEELAEKSNFIETAYLIIYGELPNSEQLATFSNQVLDNASIHESMRQLFEYFPATSHPMAILSALLNSLGCYYPEMTTNDRQRDLEQFSEAAAVLISKVHTIAAMSYRMKEKLPIEYPKTEVAYAENFLHMMFSKPYNEFSPSEEVIKALDLIFLLHADHEQNCSTSTVRMVASGGANLFASVSAGVSALWGPLHGGANMAVIKMLRNIHESRDNGSQFIQQAKEGKARLMGFGHRVYKNYDPRAKILSHICDQVLSSLDRQDPLLDIARHLEERALNDEYFIQRKLYPNVDFYSGIILQAIGLPLDMFTVMFAIGRLPGWIANWKEIAEEPKSRIHRPRQIYTGYNERHYVPMGDR